MSCTDIQAKIDYFNKLGDKWDETVGNNNERLERLRDVFKMIKICNGNKVVDVGCGNGVLFQLIEEIIGPDGLIEALEPAETMISRAKILYPQYSNINYIMQTAENADLKNNYFDAIICFAVFPHIDKKEYVLRLFKRILKKNGKLYIFHLSDTKSLNEFHSSINGPVANDMMPERDELKEMLDAASLSLHNYIDTPGFNFIECEPC